MFLAEKKDTGMGISLYICNINEKTAIKNRRESHAEAKFRKTLSIILLFSLEL